jgi:hypothetical protein
MADVQGDDDTQVESEAGDPGQAVSRAGLDVMRDLESILRNLGQGR